MVLGPSVCLLLVAAAGAAELKPETLQAYLAYIRAVDARQDGQAPFLWTDHKADRREQVRRGQPVVEPTGAKPEIHVFRGIIHDWTGAVFIPGVTLRQVQAVVYDYARHKDIYQPEVIDSRVISRNGNHFHTYLRLLKKKVITVVLDTEHDVERIPVDANRSRSHSYTTKIQEVRDAGKNTETRLPPGTGHGFLWRLDSYWRFEERDQGVYVECQAVSLTRDVPAGLGWLIEPIIRTLPRESLANTLRATGNALRGTS